MPLTPLHAQVLAGYFLVINLLQRGNRNADLQYTHSKFAVVPNYPCAGPVCRCMMNES